MAYEGYPQEKGTVGIAFIITNDYEGDDALAGPQFDGKKWEKCLGDLCFDVRSKSNMSKENTIAFLKAHTDERIPIRGPDCHYVIFVFSGHGEESVLYSQDDEPMSLEKDLLPLFFDKGNFQTVPKLIFLDACRTVPRKKRNLSLGDSLSKVWKKGMAGYYYLCAVPSGYEAPDGDSGSVFSEVVTRLLSGEVDLSSLGKETGDKLTSHATENKTNPTSVNYGCCEPLGTERVLLRLAKGAF
jgi:hypothetical protein